MERVQLKHELEELQARLKTHEEESREHSRATEDLIELQTKYTELSEAHEPVKEDLKKALEHKNELTKTLEAAKADAETKHSELSEERSRLTTEADRN